MSDGRRFPVLDGLRWLGAAGIAISHIPVVFEGGRDLVRSAELGVDLYFVLSGFIHAHAFGPEVDQGVGLGTLMWQRAIRFWPLYILGSAIGAAVYLAQMLVGDGAGFGVGKLAITGATSLFILPTPAELSINGGAVHFPFNGPAYLLFYELFFLTPLFFVVRKWLPGKGLAAATLLAGAALVAVWFLLGRIDVGFKSTHFWPAFVRLAYPFLVGMLVYRMWARSEVTLPAPGWLLIAGAMAFFVLICWPRPPLAPWPPYLALVLFAWPALVFVTASMKPGPVASKVLQGLGVTAFATYILHYSVLGAIDRAWDKLGWPSPAVLAWRPLAPDGFTLGIIAFYLLFAAAMFAVRRGYDLPMRRSLTARIMWRPELQELEVRV